MMNEKRFEAFLFSLYVFVILKSKSYTKDFNIWWEAWKEQAESEAKESINRIMQIEKHSINSTSSPGQWKGHPMRRLSRGLHETHEQV